MSNSVQVYLKNVRISFPKLFVPEAFRNEPDGKKKYGASFIMDKVKDAETIKSLQTTIAQMLSDKGEKGKALKLGADKIALKDGGEGEYATRKGYGDKVMFIGASNSDKPPVVDQRKKDIIAEKNVNPFIKAGDYVDAVINLSYQNNQFGKRVNAYLGSVQLRKSCSTEEALGASAVDPDEVFEEIPFDDEEV